MPNKSSEETPERQVAIIVDCGPSMGAVPAGSNESDFQLAVTAAIGILSSYLLWANGTGGSVYTTVICWTKNPYVIHELSIPTVKSISLVKNRLRMRREDQPSEIKDMWPLLTVGVGGGTVLIITNRPEETLELQKHTSGSSWRPTVCHPRYSVPFSKRAIVLEKKPEYIFNGLLTLPHVSKIGVHSVKIPVMGYALSSSSSSFTPDFFYENKTVVANDGIVGQNGDCKYLYGLDEIELSSIQHTLIKDQHTRKGIQILEFCENIEPWLYNGPSICLCLSKQMLDIREFTIPFKVLIEALRTKRLTAIARYVHEDGAMPLIVSLAPLPLISSSENNDLKLVMSMLPYFHDHIPMEFPDITDTPSPLDAVVEALIDKLDDSPSVSLVPDPVTERAFQYVTSQTYKGINVPTMAEKILETQASHVMSLCKDLNIEQHFH